MKGKILGYDADAHSGVITGEDGHRYRFTEKDWRSDRRPAAGASVDFDRNEDCAIEVYSLNASIGGISAETLKGPNSEKIVRLFTQSLATPLAVIVLFAMFLPAISSPMSSMSTFGLGNMPDLSGISMLLNNRSDNSVGAIQSLMFLRFAAPLTAIWLIWAAAAGKSTRLPMIACAASALIAALLAFAFRSALLSMMGPMGAAMGNAVSVGIGSWLLVLAGLALFAAAFGIVKNPLADR